MRTVEGQLRQGLAHVFELKAHNMDGWKDLLTDPTDKKVCEACAVAYRQCAKDAGTLSLKDLGIMENMTEVYFPPGNDFLGIFSDTQKEDTP